MGPVSIWLVPSSAYLQLLIAQHQEGPSPHHNVTAETGTMEMMHLPIRNSDLVQAQPMIKKQPVRQYPDPLEKS